MSNKLLTTTPPTSPARASLGRTKDREELNIEPKEEPQKAGSATTTCTSPSHASIPHNQTPPRIPARKRTRDIDEESSQQQALEEAGREESRRQTEAREEAMGWKEEILQLGLPLARTRSVRYVKDELLKRPMVVLVLTRLGNASARNQSTSKLLANPLLLENTGLPTETVTSIQYFASAEQRSEVHLVLEPRHDTIHHLQRLVPSTGVVYDPNTRTCFLFSAVPATKPPIAFEVLGKPLGMPQAEQRRILIAYKAPTIILNNVPSPPVSSEITRSARDMTDPVIATFCAKVYWNMIRGSLEGALYQVPDPIHWAKGCAFCGADHTICPVKPHAECLLASAEKAERRQARPAITLDQIMAKGTTKAQKKKRRA
ncbi:hypothetical protein IAR50_004381 [Cryptococcus sp. DSM 104548]